MCLSRCVAARGAAVFVFVTSLAGAPQPVAAVALQEPPVFELPDVVAPGRRLQPRTATPANVSVLTAADLARLGVRTVGEALAYLPEVYVRSLGGPGALQEISIRGTSSAHTLVLLDGVPLNSPAQGLAQLNTIPVDIVERIEVLRGPFSAIYGSGALGGVVRIVTRRAPGGAARAGAGTQGSAHAITTWGWRRDGAGVRLDAVHDRSQGFRPNSDYAGSTLAGRLTLDLGTGRTFSLGLSQFWADQGVPGSTAFPSPLARQQSGRTALDAVWRLEGPADHRRTLRAWGLADDITFTDPAFAATTRTRATALGLEGQAIRSLSAAHVVTVGWEVQRHAVEMQSSSLFGTSALVRDAWVGALYVASDRTLDPATLLSGGLRVDLHSVYGSQLNPRVGLVRQLDDRTVLRAAVGHTFRGPSFLLLFFPGCSNPALAPERAWAADAGLERTLAPGLVGRLVAYATVATDLIRPGCPPVNVDRATIVGASAELEGRLAPALALRAHVTTTNGRDGAGGALIRVPAWSAAATLHWTVRPQTTLSLLALYAGARPDLDFSTFPATPVVLPAYTVLGLRYTLATGAGTWQLGVDNLLDAPYEPVAGFPAPGRTVFVSYATSF
ncbi:MAG: TonB-dependent receptor [Armatimonadota bacterium]|nr:TonB-dependent receptor [Armatimonadota bacterium]MDR7532431.1 TonB-dependent receptor [Armatimonadota bacterium]MDR7535654.1 TonB-dependent receptor [Armatimonadota bacterium]